MDFKLMELVRLVTCDNQFYELIVITPVFYFFIVNHKEYMLIYPWIQERR